MAVDSIGSTLSSTISGLSRSSLSQDDFIKLFLTQLSFQDPLDPVDNREFLAQMAQFANLEQARVANENTNNLVVMNATTQSLGLLGKQVSVDASETGGLSATGAVSAISFSPSGPVLTVTKSDGSVMTDVRLSQITLVRQ